MGLNRKLGSYVVAPVVSAVILLSGCSTIRNLRAYEKSLDNLSKNRVKTMSFLEGKVHGKYAEAAIPYLNDSIDLIIEADGIGRNDLGTIEQKKASILYIADNYGKGDGNGFVDVEEAEYFYNTSERMCFNSFANKGAESGLLKDIKRVSKKKVDNRF